MAKKKKAATKKKAASIKVTKKKKASSKAKKRSPAKSTARKAVSKKPSSDLDHVQQQLQVLLEKEDSSKKILALLLPLDEKQRAKLAPDVAKWYRKVKRNEWIEEPPNTTRWNPLLGPAGTAILCVCGFTEIKKTGWWRLPDEKTTLQILQSRKPKWGDQFADWLLSTSNYWTNWKLVRDLVLVKLCRKPVDNPRYYTGMISGLCRWGPRKKKITAYKALKADPDLLKDEVWRLFEYEGDGENTLANCERFGDDDWAGALVKLSKEGFLSRSKLLKSSLAALELGFNNYRSKWFQDFFDALEPTDTELKQHAATILELTASPTTNTAQWAFQKLQYLGDHSLLTPAKTVTAIEPLLTAKSKNTVLACLKILEQIATDHPKLAADACITATSTLGHEKADVQKVAFDFIKKHSNPTNEAMNEAVRKYAPLVAASLQKKVAEWIDSGTGETPKSAVTKKPVARRKIVAKPAANLSKYSKQHLELMKIPELNRLLDASNEDRATAGIPAATFLGDEFSRLDPARAVQPITDFDELLEVCARAIEDDSLIDDGERALAGLARIGNNKPDDFAKRVAPLFKRCKQLIKRGKSPFSGQSLSTDLCGLICIWANGSTISHKKTKNEHGHPVLQISGMLDDPYDIWYWRETTPLSFLSSRCFEIGKRLNRESFELLGAPTHEGGWISPLDFVQRVNNMEHAPIEEDLILGMLRLAPDNRTAALKALKPKARTEWVDAIRHSLGGNVSGIGKNRTLWACAARTRSPFADDPKVAKSFPKIGPGGGKVALFKIEHKIYTHSHSAGESPYVRIATTEPPPKLKQRVSPTQMFSSDPYDYSTRDYRDLGRSPGSINWLETMTPLAHDTFFAAGAECLCGNRDWWEADWYNRCFLEPLLDSDLAPGETGLFMLLCGLACKEPGEHGLATDIMIRAIEDGRVGSDNLGLIFANNLTPNLFNLTRIAARLADLVSVSHLHAWVIWRALEQSLPTLPQSRRALGDFLELTFELGSQLGCALNEECQSHLRSFTGSSKTARAAKQCLTLEGEFDASDCVQSALAHRIRRLEVWQAR